MREEELLARVNLCRNEERFPAFRNAWITALNLAADHGWQPEQDFEQYANDGLSVSAADAWSLADALERGDEELPYYRSLKEALGGECDERHWTRPFRADHYTVVGEYFLDPYVALRENPQGLRELVRWCREGGFTVASDED